MTKGTGQVMINNQTVDKYFVLPEYVNTVLQPLQLTGLDKSVDVGVMVSGGGKVGQSIAVRHGIARALLLLDENYRKQLRPAGYLTRDARVKERKKPGLKRARRAPQFSKR
jgi:small subunit ribosomal protein S9